MDPVTSVAFWSAIATACSALFIGWQAWETRRTAEASRKAASDSRDAVKIANDTLELATEQAQQSAILAKDSIRARLDIKAPAISMTIRQGGSRVAAGFAISTPDSPQVLRNVDTFEEEQFELPRDNDTVIYAMYRVSFHNDGLVPVTIRSNSLGRSSSGFFSWEETLRVPVGEYENAMLAIGASAEEWARAWDKGTSPPAHGWWETVLHEDTGVMLSQKFHVEATMIQPIEAGVSGGNYCIPSDKLESRRRASLVFGDQKRAYIIAGEHVESLAPTVKEANMLAIKNPG